MRAIVGVVAYHRIFNDSPTKIVRLDSSRFKIFELNSASIILVGLLIWGSTYIDRFFLLRYFPPIDQATYQVTYQVASLIGLILAQLANLHAIKILQDNDKERLSKNIGILTREYIVLASILFFPLLMFQEIFFTAKYEMSIKLFSNLYFAQSIGGLAALFFSVATINILNFNRNFIYFLVLMFSNLILSLGITQMPQIYIEYLGQVNFFAASLSLVLFIVSLNRHTEFLRISRLVWLELSLIFVLINATNFMSDRTNYFIFSSLVLYTLVRFRTNWMDFLSYPSSLIHSIWNPKK
jgi:O-antigen/teichoic acid export membrane protein